MYIFNRTTNISEEAHDKWLDWMRKTHIPAILATGKFTKAILAKVMIEEEMGGITYATQYFCESPQKLLEFIQENEAVLEKEENRLFEGQIVSFETELNVIESFPNSKK